MPELPPVLSASDISMILGSLAALITAVGAGAWWKAKREVERQEGPSSTVLLVQAINENSRAVADHADTYHVVIEEVRELKHIMTEIRLDLRDRR